VMHPRRRVLGIFTTACALGTAALATLPVAAAQANLVSFNACDNSSLSQPYLQWADSDLYKLAPGGDGSLTGWSLQGGAQQTAGGEPWNVSGTSTNSLLLPAGAVAASPQTCVNAAYPTFRFFSLAGTPGSSASVTVVYNTLLGPVSIPVGTVSPDTSWEPSVPMTTLSAIPGLLQGGTANVQLQFTGVSGTVEVSDVYVDPWNHG